MSKTPEKTLTLSSPYSWAEQYDYGEIDSAGSPIVGEYHDHRVGFYESTKAMQRKAATPDTLGNKASTLPGIVLFVLSGPSANNDASTGGRLTKLLSVEGTRPWWEELSIFTGKKPQLRAIVKCYAYTPDLPMPSTDPPTPEDEFIIAQYPEYVALDPDLPGLADIRPGCMVGVRHDQKALQGGGALPGGIIVEVYGQKPPDTKELRPSSKAGFSPKCASPLRLTGSGGGNYVGHTVPLIDSGQLVSKIKNKIPLGVFGEGSVQTKSHFVASLKINNTSLMKKLPGIIEAEKDAFVWVGHMKNNGYMDYVDRPPDIGRETIIYAPKYLDTGSPIELKYYFHDRSGFGYSWVMGPGTTVAQSIKHAALGGNDFAEVIAPAIKDLTAAGRNFILVIPEMMHSRGYGTPKGNAGRVIKLKTGEGSGKGSTVPYGDVLRVILESDTNKSAMTAMKGVIDGYSLPNGFKDDGSPLPERKLSTITRWKERVYSTFDNSYTGGSFSKFHGEVKSVVEKYLGTGASESIDYVSISAAGASIATMAAMSTYDGKDSAFTMTIDRIDFVDNIGYDSIQPGSAAGGLGNRFPSAIFYENFVKPLAMAAQPLEFNYFTSYFPFIYK